MKLIIRKLVIVFLLIVVSGGGFYLYRNQQQEPDNQLLLYGNVDIRQVQLAFHQTGRLKKIYVQEGDKVNAGTLLAEIDAVRSQT